jgi:hypothetical protein
LVAKAIMFDRSERDCTYMVRNEGIQWQWVKCVSLTEANVIVLTIHDQIGVSPAKRVVFIEVRSREFDGDRLLLLVGGQRGNQLSIRRLIK